jgi:diguanylate cyclase (GGDEF)-like protein
MKSALAVALGIQVVSIAALIFMPTDQLPSVFLSLVVLGLIVHQLRVKPPIEVVIDKKVAERTDKLVKLMTHYEQQAMTDALTGLLNRRGGEDSIGHHIARSLRIKTGISFILVDIDHFKQVNDRYGHAVGDLVISGVANAIKTHLRNADFAIRWGGEEFLVCAPDTDLLGATILGEKLRQAVEATNFDLDYQVTISLGCAELGEDPFNIALARADMHLYFAKSKGRNQVFPNSSHKRLDEA